MWAQELTTKNYNYNKPLLQYPKSHILINQQNRQLMIIARILKGALKVRYLLLGGAVGGSVTLQKKYEEWKNGLPDVSWASSLMPTEQQWKDFRTSLMEMKDSVNNSIELDRRMKEFKNTKVKEYSTWFNQRLNNAIKVANDTDKEDNSDDLIASEIDAIRAFVIQIYSDMKDEVRKSTTAFAATEVNTINKNKLSSKSARVDEMQDEVMKIQLKYQRELERLERENKELRKQILLHGKATHSSEKIKKSLIDMYSEVLDELSEFDSTYATSYHLPRVVVVGDQSSGKTSVLEMIAQARIFPRGAGEMMTRSPVKVTLSEGPYHIAQFKDSAREFDLSSETELAELRNEIELRMKNSVKDGNTVSQDVIAMTVKGPGLPRMVLVDLPGIISTVTMEMAKETRDDIRQMTQLHMSNPNSIILCIQDGSVDAERSNVTDLVSQMDPTGKRTIFVLTKVDIAEKNMTNPERLKKILSGKLFPMKALGYFAVVTGRGRQDDTIDTIKEYEEQFFRNSKLFKGELATSSQVTTRNLSLAVAECFWKMIRETVEQQADAFKATRYNLETEWKNLFPSFRELDRNELFEKARHQILDDVIKLSQIPPRYWEQVLQKQLWLKLRSYIFNDIYLPAVQTRNENKFNTIVDIKLREWSENSLPLKCIESGWECMRNVFQEHINENNTKSNHDDIFDALIKAVVDESTSRFTWEDKALEMLRAIQTNTLEDRNVSDVKYWNETISFFETALKEQIKDTDEIIRNLIGPDFKDRWLYWKYSSKDEQKHKFIKNEIDKVLYLNKQHMPSITVDEMTIIRTNGRYYGIEIDKDDIEEIWEPMFKKFILQQSLSKAYDCKKGFYLYQNGLDTTMECSDIIMFWRIHHMLNVTSSSLRQQIINREARRLGNEIEDTLENYSQDNVMKKKLLNNKKVILAEELKRVRQIQDKLEDFIRALNAEK